MEDLLASSDYKIKSFSRGEKVKAKLLRVGERFAAFDIGGKGEGIINEANFSEARNLIESLKPGDEVTAIVLEPESRDGTALLSLRNAAHEDFWRKVRKHYDDEVTIDVVVKSVSAHGLVVNFESESAFIPNSHLGAEASARMNDLIGERLKAKIIDLDPSQNRIVLSERAVSEASEIEQTSKALADIKAGQKLAGVITTITSFGVFVRISVPVEKTQVEVEGLVHVSELSWAKVEHPEDVYSVGDKIEVVVLGFEKGKLALSARQAQKDPWEAALEKYQPDSKVKGKVVRTSDFGVFVELEKGIEGLIHMTKIPPGTALTIGQEVLCYVEDVNKSERKIALGVVVTAAKPIGYK